MNAITIERLYAAYDGLGLDRLPDDSVVVFRSPDRSHTYAALFVADRWYVTGREAPNGLATEDFVAWLIGKGIEATALIEMVPS